MIRPADGQAANTEVGGPHGAHLFHPGLLGGVVGRQKFLYDLWGDTVTIASRLATGQENVILVTRPVHDRLVDLHQFGPARNLEIQGKGTVEFWQLENT